MIVEERRERRRWRGGSGGCGCVSFFFVLTVGLLLSLFDLAVGAGGSIRIPFTSANFTVAGSVGEKDKAPNVLPPYVHGRLASNHDFFNQSNTLTIWVAEGTFIVVLGEQEGAPVIDLHLEAR